MSSSNSKRYPKAHVKSTAKKEPSKQETSATPGGSTTPAGAKPSSWTAGEEGNAVSWLAKLTQGKEQPKSAGALEYLSKKKDLKSSKAKNNSPPPSAQKGGSGKPGNNNSNNSNNNKAGNKSETNQASKKRDAVTSAPSGGINLEELSKLCPQNVVTSAASDAKTGSQPPKTEDGVPAEKLSADAKLTPPPASQGRTAQPSSGGQRDSRNRQNRHQQDRDAQRKRRQEEIAKRQKEMQDKHEEALKNDPEYRKQYADYQQVQDAMAAAQNEMLTKYAQQEVIQRTQIVTERLNIPEILDVIEQHDVVFICTDTGSGKSTNVPKALLELSPDTRVVSTQPRRTATIAIANRVASLRREAVGEDVGYWIRGEKKGDEQTRLWYMTSYTLLLRILESPSDLPFTHVVLDEFHERQPDIEVTVALLRLALLHSKGEKKFKLILMSATLYSENWEEYFDGLRVATYKQSEPDHPIHDYFLEDACALLGMNYKPAENLVALDVVPKATIDVSMNIAQNLIVFLNRCCNPTHSILVFLPGRAQVETLQAWLLAQMSATVDAIPWHSAIDLADIERAMQRQGFQRQKVYLATDIAEVSITLPDVVFVIDLVLVKRPKINKTNAASIMYPPLLTQWISKSSVSQRRGRVGRVQQGFYYCLFPMDQFKDLPDYAQPPIENSRIDELSLHCLEVVSNPAAIFGLCHGQPLAETVAVSMNTLQQLGCIIPEDDPNASAEEMTETRGGTGKEWNNIIMSSVKEAANTDVEEFYCTFIGRLLQLIPVSPQPGTLVFYGFLTGLESLMILAAAVTSSLSPFTVESIDGRRYNIARAMEETENAMRNMCCGLRSDVLAVMKAVLQFRLQDEENERQGGDGGGGGGIDTAGGNGVAESRQPAVDLRERHKQVLKQWCAQNHLSLEKLQAITDMERHIKCELASFMPFRDITSPAALLDQLDKLASMVVAMTSVAFVSQSLEVTSESNTYLKSKEMGLGVFNELVAMPDIHSPSCLRWQDDDIIIPIQLNLMFDKLLAGFSTAVESPKQFWMSLLLFSYQLNYATFSDDEGTFHVFKLTFCGKSRFVELDEVSGLAVIEFRRKLNRVCASLRLLHTHRDMFEDELVSLLAEHNLKPIPEAQRDIITTLATIFKNLGGMTADEVEHDEDDLDLLSTLSFRLLPTKA